MTDQFRGRADTAEKESPAARCVDTTRAERKCRKRLRPAMLLRLETVHIHRQLGRSDHVGQINKFPARELRAIAKIQVFAERISLPASTLLDTGTPPETRGPIEIEKPAATAARGLLKQKVPIQKNRLHSREQRIPTIKMPPTGLDHSDLRISKEMDCAL